METEEALEAVLQSELYSWLQVEYHNWNDGKRPIPFMKSVLQRMITKDLRVFSVEPNIW